MANETPTADTCMSNPLVNYALLNIFTGLSILYTSWLPGFTRAPPSRTLLPFSLPPSPPPSLPPSMPPSSLPLPISILGLPGFAQNICVIVQDNCFPESYFEILSSKIPQFIDS